MYSERSSPRDFDRFGNISPKALQIMRPYLRSFPTLGHLYCPRDTPPWLQGCANMLQGYPSWGQGFSSWLPRAPPESLNAFPHPAKAQGAPLIISIGFPFHVQGVVSRTPAGFSHLSRGCTWGSQQFPSQVPKNHPLAFQWSSWHAERVVLEIATELPRSSNGLRRPIDFSIQFQAASCRVLTGSLACSVGTY